MYRALVSFSGLISMSKGEVGNIPDRAVANDLLKAGYIEKVETAKKATAKKTK